MHACMHKNNLNKVFDRMIGIRGQYHNSECLFVYGTWEENLMMSLKTYYPIHDHEEDIGDEGGVGYWIILM